MKKRLVVDSVVVTQHILWISTAVIAALLVLGAAAVCNLADRPLGPELQVTPPMATTVQRAVTPAATPTAMSTAIPTAQPTQEITVSEGAGMCGQQGRVTVLLLGESLPEQEPLRGASAIRMIQIDFDTGRVRVLALPPYLLVPTPALAPDGIQSSVLTLVYWQALPLEAGSERARMAYATNVFAQVLVDNFALVPNNYITLKQGVFVEMIDAVGGLSIDLPEDVDGSPSGFPQFYAGEQVLDGQAVLDYVRIYPAAGDTHPIEWERLERQRQVLRALRVQLLRPQTLTRLPTLARRFYQDVVTDLSLSQVLTFACVLQSPVLSIEYLALSPDMVVAGPGNVLTPKMEKILEFLETSFVQ